MPYSGPNEGRHNVIDRPTCVACRHAADAVCVACAAPVCQAHKFHEVHWRFMTSGKARSDDSQPASEHRAADAPIYCAMCGKALTLGEYERHWHPQPVAGE